MFKNIILTLERIERRQKLILEKLDQMSARPQADAGNGPFNDKWLQDGIDNILSYQAGKKREGEQ